MAVTETTHHGYFNRLGNSFKGMLVGVFFFFASIMLLFWNEGRAVKRSAALKEGAAAAIHIDATKIDPANLGKLVHFSGLPEVHGELSDPLLKEDFKALGLIRKIEMYQWTENVEEEEKINVGGSSDVVTTYSYQKGWSDELIPSGGFKEEGHDNPQKFPVPQLRQFANGVTLGAFRIPDDRVKSICTFVNIVPQAAITNALPAGMPAGLIRTENGYYFSAEGATNVPAKAAIGDTKITFQIAYPRDISFVAAQQDDTIAPYVTKNGGSIFLQSSGIKTVDEMFESAKAANKTTTTLLRIAGFILMFLGISALLNPLKVLMDVLPFLGRIMQAGVAAISAMVALMVSFVTIAIAWLAYRPILAVLLLIAAGGVGFLIWKKTRAAKQD